MVALALIALAVVLAAQTRAQRPSSQAVDYFTDAAAAQWHAWSGLHPCRPVVVWEPMLGGVGEARWGKWCIVMLAEQWARRLRDSWALLCRVLMHEVGHLAGFEHSADSRNVMYPAVNSAVTTCPIAGWVR